MLENIAAAVDARSLAVPHREDAVVFCRTEKRDLLCAPDRGCGEILVHPGLEFDGMRFEVRVRVPKRLVQAAERRAAITGNESCGVDACRLIAQALHD